MISENEMKISRIFEDLRSFSFFQFKTQFGRQGSWENDIE
jgi:hypothetical protein